MFRRIAVAIYARNATFLRGSVVDRSAQALKNECSLPAEGNKTDILLQPGQEREDILNCFAQGYISGQRPTSINAPQ
jgi:hypothetical protein